MYLSEIDKLDLSPEGKAELHIDPASAITHDEFMRHLHDGVSYRDRAVKRLIGLGIPFSSECNIIFEMSKKLLKAVCPYCHRNMEAKGGGGSGSQYSVDFVCPKCHSKVSITLPSDGISVYPSDEVDDMTREVPVKSSKKV